jgi:NADPH:quinone reductase-like Zn-dependent oxidoreductase
MTAEPQPTHADAIPPPAVGTSTMRAIIQHGYGPPDALHVRDIDRPTIGATEVLVRVHAASLHIGDCFGVRGAPLPMRLASGLLRPKHAVPGTDLAGRVEGVGADVTMFKVGDEVFGAGHGACAQYARARENQLAPKPANLSFEEAAAVPTSGVAALHGLRDAGRLRPGQKVLINGASGGVGTFAVQIAKALGAEVTGVCGSANRDTVRLLGADRVVDYTELDFTRGPYRYDLILDNIENRTLAHCRRALTPYGTLVLNSGTGARGITLMTRLLTPLVLSQFTRQTFRRFLSAPNRRDLLELKTLIEDVKVTPVIDKVYQLGETPAALRHIEGGHARGKVVVAMLAS